MATATFPAWGGKVAKSVFYCFTKNHQTDELNEFSVKVNEISTFVEAYNNENYDKNEVTNLFSLYQDLNIELLHIH